MLYSRLKRQGTTEFSLREGADESGCIIPSRLSKSTWIWHLGSWFSGDCGGAELVLGLDDLGGIFKPEKLNVLGWDSFCTVDIAFCNSWPYQYQSYLLT